MNTPMYVVRPGKSPAWVVRWTRDSVRKSRHFPTEAEAWEFSRSLPRPVYGGQGGRGLRYASDSDRVALNVTISPSGCWEWNLYKHPSEGYGYLTLRGRRLLAHRFSYETFVGAIPDGLHIDHLCRNRGCVNPAHLEPVTCLENVRRAPWHLAEINRTKTECVNGHAYTDENTGRTGKYGYRYCRTCARAHARRSHERRILRAAGIEVAA